MTNFSPDSLERMYIQIQALLFEAGFTVQKQVSPDELAKLALIEHLRVMHAVETTRYRPSQGFLNEPFLDGDKLTKLALDVVVIELGFGIKYSDLAEDVNRAGDLIAKVLVKWGYRDPMLVDKAWWDRWNNHNRNLDFEEFDPLTWVKLHKAA